MYHVSAQGVDERMINVHYYYYKRKFLRLDLMMQMTGCAKPKQVQHFSFSLSTMGHAVVADTNLCNIKELYHS